MEKEIEDLKLIIEEIKEERDMWKDMFDDMSSVMEDIRDMAYKAL